MSEMIERVARALDPVAWLAPEGPAFRLQRSRELAVAAIEAMREPTMRQLETYCDPRNEAMQQAVAAEWRGMIDAALGPETASPTGR